MQPVKFLKFLRQFVVLVERNLQLIWNDKLLLASLTLQSPFMVLVVKLTADPNCFTSNLVNIGSRTALFVLAAMATFMGTLNSYREISRPMQLDENIVSKTVIKISISVSSSRWFCGTCTMETKPKARIAACKTSTSSSTAALLSTTAGRLTPTDASRRMISRSLQISR